MAGTGFSTKRNISHYSKWLKPELGRDSGCLLKIACEDWVRSIE